MSQQTKIICLKHKIIMDPQDSDDETVKTDETENPLGTSTVDFHNERIMELFGNY